MEYKGWRDIPIGGMILEAGNSVEYHTGDWRAFRPIMGQANCTHCFLCWLYCPDSSILVDVESQEMVGFDLDHCKGCGICAAVCPINLRVKRKVPEADQSDLRLCIRMVEESAGDDR
jgi:pyruvate ferredoxin oxidoreductase delta subunit